MSRQQQPHLTMMAPGDALRQEVFRSMNVSTSSKTPYSDATQVGHSQGPVSLFLSGVAVVTSAKTSLGRHSAEISGWLQLGQDS